MPLPSKDYYYLDELLCRWNRTMHDLQYYIENGLLKIAVWYDGTLEYGCYKEFANGQSAEICQSLKNHHGLIPLDQRICRLLFKGKYLNNDYFAKDDDSYCKAYGKDRLDIRKEDVVICANELKRFEQEHDISQNTEETKITIKNDFQEITIGTTTYQFGPTLSQVIKQLYEASQTDSPWVNGKVLLANAGSELFKLSDLCKRHPAWGTLIISDKRGSYRIKI